MTNQYWAHKSVGEVFAVQVENGKVVTACGPLHYSEVTEANLTSWNFDGEPELAAWLNEVQDEFRLVEPPYQGDEN